MKSSFATCAHSRTSLPQYKISCLFLNTTQAAFIFGSDCWKRIGEYPKIIEILASSHLVTITAFTLNLGQGEQRLATATPIMFAAHDQENLVSIHQTAANTKQQQNARTLPPKTPGNRYPKTPLKVPLNDENTTRGLGAGKSVLGTSKPKLDRSQFVTPGGNSSFPSDHSHTTECLLTEISQLPKQAALSLATRPQMPKLGKISP